MDNKALGDYEADAHVIYLRLLVEGKKKEASAVRREVLNELKGTDYYRHFLGWTKGYLRFGDRLGSGFLEEMLEIAEICAEI